MVLGSHYQKNLEFSYEALDQAENDYKKLKNRINALNKDKDNLDESTYNKYQETFKEAIGNNLNTSLALTTLYDVLKSDTNDYTKVELIKSFDQVLSLDLLKEEKEEIDEEILELVNLRTKYKKDKNFEEADKVRDKLLSLGYKVLDTREGVKVERI